MALGGYATLQDDVLPPYTVRRSTRARRVRLSVTPRDGLVVVVPQWWRGDTRLLVAGKEAWAREALDRIAPRRALYASGPEGWLPSHVALAAADRVLKVEYVSREGALVSARDRGSAIEVSGNVTDAAGCVSALRRWLTRSAREVLGGKLETAAVRHGMHYRRLRIGAPSSRWGSCSASGTISLSRNLLFLPPELAEAVVLHELAHTVVLDHSPRFWATLAGLDPAAPQHRARLKDAGHLVPVWADG